MTIDEARTLAQEHLDASGVAEQGQRLVIFPDDGAAPGCARSSARGVG